MKYLALLGSVVFLIAGCGGGGSSGVVRPQSPSVTPEPPPAMPEPPPVTTDPVESESELRQEYAAHPEFRNQPALQQVNAHYAYARGATGEGVTIGIIDSGIDAGHSKFDGKVLPESYNVAGYNPDYSFCAMHEPDGSCSFEGGPPSHGTLVGGVMAANRQTDAANGTGSEFAVHGIAFDAKLISVGIPFGEPPDYYDPIDLSLPGSLTSTDLEFAEISNRLNPSVTAINLSFGFFGNIEDYNETEVRGALPRTLEAIAQAATPASERTIYVWAAGNARGEVHFDGTIEAATSVEIVAGLPIRIPELRGHSVAVVATDQNGEIASFSSRCGIAKDFCLAAPGVELTGPLPNSYCPTGSGDCYASASGTSLAAPVVTGGVALLAQYYRDQLGNDEIVRRMLETANKEGIYADSDVYGQGFLDLDSATRPVGDTRMLTGQSLSGPSAPGSLSTVSLGPAFGDALSHGLASSEIASFDELDAPFFRPLNDYIQPNASAGARLEERLWVLGNDPRGGAWNTQDIELRMRLEPVSDRRHYGLILSGISAGANAEITGLHSYTRRGTGYDTIESRLASLSLTRRVGDNEVFFGLRSHPGWRFGLHATGSITPGTFTDDAAFTNPFLTFARNGAAAGIAMPIGKGALSVAAFHGAAQYGERRDIDSSQSTGALAEYRFTHNMLSGVALQVGWLMEPDRLAGSRPSGAFGELGADTAFSGVSAYRRLGDRWTVLGSVHAGVSRTETQYHGMLHDLSALWTSTFAVGIIGEGVGYTQDRLAFRLSQPLRVESGDTRFRWASGRTRHRQVEIEETTLDLEPSGRQLDLELTYGRPWKGGRAQLVTLVSHQARHTRGDNDFALLMRYNRSF